jgi:hypothetical protein
MDGGMTPLNRLIPRSSGDSTIHRSEKETMRTPSAPGMGSIPPMTPGPMIDGRRMDDFRGDDLVSEILRDVETSSPTIGMSMGGGDGSGRGYVQQQSSPNQDDPMLTEFHPSQFQEKPDEPSSYRRKMFRGEGDDEEDDDSPPIEEIRGDKNRKNTGEETDFIGMILDEMKLPLLVALLILGAGSTGLDETISKVLPNVIFDGKMGIIGLILKAVIGGLIFYALKRIFL